MSGANYEHCPLCHKKAVYDGDDEEMFSDCTAIHYGCIDELTDTELVRRLRVASADYQGEC